MRTIFTYGDKVEATMTLDSGARIVTQRGKVTSHRFYDNIVVYRLDNKTTINDKDFDIRLANSETIS